MRHFGHLTPEVRQRLFHREACVFDTDSPARLLSAALGATLYSPATRPRLADDIVKQAGRGSRCRRHTAHGGTVAAAPQG